MFNRKSNPFNSLLITLMMLTGCGSTAADTSGGSEDDRTAGQHILNCIEASGHHVYKRTMKCPLGGEEFEALALGTHSTYGVSLDWESVSYMRFPVPIPICPSNGYIILNEDASDDEIERTTAVIESPEYQSLYAQRHATYYLYAKLTELLGKNEEDRWWYYRQATSEADLCEAPERYRQYALATIVEGERKMAQLSEAENEYWTLSIVIPNMYRRLGQFDAAKSWLDQFNQVHSGDGEDGDFYRLARKLLIQAIADGRSERISIEEKEDE